MHEITIIPGLTFSGNYFLGVVGAEEAGIFTFGVLSLCPPPSKRYFSPSVMDYNQLSKMKRPEASPVFFGVPKQGPEIRMFICDVSDDGIQR